jgi:transcriptional regulator with XRE-family HTH domain
MPQKSKFSLPPLPSATQDESVGRRIARLRKERGYTQLELAERIGINQVLVSDYERDRLRLTAEMAVRFALALEVSTDELLGVRAPARTGKKPSRKLLRRMERIETLPPSQQLVLLKTIDTFLRAAQK